MPCIEQRNRMEDKLTEWDVAMADLNNARRLFHLSAAAVFASCVGTLFSLGVAGPACAAAIAGEVYASIEKDTAEEKADIAKHAYLQAVAHYGTCLAKLNPSSEQ